MCAEMDSVLGVQTALVSRADVKRFVGGGSIELGVQRLCTAAMREHRSQSAPHSIMRLPSHPINETSRAIHGSVMWRERRTHTAKVHPPRRPWDPSFFVPRDHEHHMFNVSCRCGGTTIWLSCLWIAMRARMQRETCSHSRSSLMGWGWREPPPRLAPCGCPAGAEGQTSAATARERSMTP